MLSCPVVAEALAAGFVEAVDESQRPQFAAIVDLETQLRAAVDAARAAWPDLDIDDAAFVAHLAARVPEPADPAAALSGLRVDDLYLACGCALGLPDAIAAFDRTFAADLDAAARRFRSEAGDDIAQQLREKLLVGPKAKIADYAGLGFLQNWVRITCARAFLDATRRKRNDRTVADSDALMAVADPDDDVELAYLKRHYRAEFKAAFAEATESLSSQQRNVLRQHLLAGLTIDQIGTLYGVHRATAARRIASAREALLSATRRKLGARLRVDRAELASIMRLIQSQLDVSFVRLLQSQSRG